MAPIYKLFFLVQLVFCFETGIAQQKMLLLDSIPYSCTSNFNLSLRTKNISKTVGLQGTIKWDTAVLKYNSITYGNSTILFSSSNMNLTKTANGYLNYIWYDNDLVGQATADSTVLFTIAFSSNGTGKGKAAVLFSSVPTSLEIDTLRTDGLPAKDFGAGFVNGSITTPYFYNFIGSGNWDDPTNWSNNEIPPAILPSCSEIFIDPVGNTECVLNITQIIGQGAKLTIRSNKKFKVPGQLNIY